MRYLLVWSRKKMMVVDGWDEVEKVARDEGRPEAVFRESDALTDAEILAERQAHRDANGGWRV